MEELKVKEIAKMLFHHTKQFDNKLDCKLKKQEIVFDTAVFHYELTYTNNGWLEFKKALEERYKQKRILSNGLILSPQKRYIHANQSWCFLRHVPILCSF